MRHTVSRIMMFADANFLAHVSRVLEIGRVLRDDFGHDVMFAGSGPFMALPSDAGFAVRPCYTVPREDTLALARRAMIVDPFWWQRVVMRSIESDIDVIRRERPDVVVGDMHWSLKAAALECAVPYVSIVNAAWTNYFEHALEAFDGHVLTRVLGSDLASRALPAFKGAALWYCGLPYKRWKRRARPVGFNVNNLLDVLEGDITLLPDVPEFCPTRDLPPRAQYIGPVLWQSNSELPGWVSALDPERPTVYASMGSTGNLTLFDLIWRAFANTEYQLIVTTGGAPWRPPSTAANVWIADFAPGLPLLKRSHVCVNHGGNGTIYQSFTAGVPVVGLGGHVDQQIQLQLCERAGAGRRLAERDLTVDGVRHAIAGVIRDASFKRCAERLQTAIRRYDGPRLAAQAIDSVAAGRATRIEERQPMDAIPVAACIES